MIGGHKVTVLYQNNMIYQFIDVIQTSAVQTSPMIFNRYIYTDIPGKYTTIHYHNNTANLITSSKYRNSINIIPTPSPF
jgi:hypothetical protein